MALPPAPHPFRLPQPDYMVFLAPRDEQTVGRRSNNSLVINDPSVSADHLRVRRQFTGLMALVEDLHSSNGTRRVYEDRDTRLSPGVVYVLPVGTLLRLGRRGPVVALCVFSEEAAAGGA